MHAKWVESNMPATIQYALDNQKCMHIIKHKVLLVLKSSVDIIRQFPAKHKVACNCILGGVIYSILKQSICHMFESHGAVSSRRIVPADHINRKYSSSEESVTSKMSPLIYYRDIF